MNKDLTQGSVWKKLLLFMLPIFGANLLHAMYGTVDLLTVGRFADSAAVSGVATGSMTIQTVGGIVIGLAMGATVRLGHLTGMRDEKRAARTVGGALCLFVGIALALTVAVTLCAPALARVMNAPVEAFSETVCYIRICGLGIVAIVLFNAVSAIFRGIGDSRTPLILMAISCGVNIAGDLLLVGVLRMGAAGAAIATVLSQALSSVFALYRMLRGGLPFAFSMRDLRPDAEEMRAVLRYGTPIALQEALTGVSFMVIMAILNAFGLVASAGVGVAEKICAILFLIPGAVMSAVSAFSAQNVGAGQRARAKRGCVCGMLWSVGIGLFAFSYSFFFGDRIAALFSADPEVIAAAADYLRSYAVDCVIVGINFSMMGYLNGCGRTGFVALQGVLSTLLVRIPVSYFMSKVPGVTLFQIGFATPLATVFAIVLTLSYLLHYEKSLRAKGKAT